MDSVINYLSMGTTKVHLSFLDWNSYWKKDQQSHFLYPELHAGVYLPRQLLLQVG